MSIQILNRHEEPWKINEGWGCFDEQGALVSSAGVGTVDSWLGKGFVRTNTVGGVGTPVEYRRRGYVRELMQAVFDAAPERGWPVSLLHPFSFAYYRQFGYERVGDHRILTFPMRALEFLPRCKELEPMDGHADEAIELYNDWAKGRNLTFRRVGKLDGHDCFANDRRHTYLYRENGRVEGYVTVEVQNHLVVNHMEGDFLHVYEMVYRTPGTLRKLLGFLRMFDGQNEVVRLHNTAMAPEVELTLRHYTHTQIQVLPDIMARILDLPAMLAQNVWPEAEGGFTLRVEDTLPNVGGLWRVEYGGGEHTVRRLEQGEPCATMTAAALVPVLYGYEAYTPELLRYAEGAEVCGDVSAFLRAFPKRNCGLYEHF